MGILLEGVRLLVCVLSQSKMEEMRLRSSGGNLLRNRGESFCELASFLNSEARANRRKSLACTGTMRSRLNRRAVCVFEESCEFKDSKDRDIIFQGCRLI